MMAEVTWWLAFGAGVLSYFPVLPPLYPSYIPTLPASLSASCGSSQPLQIRRAPCPYAVSSSVFHDLLRPELSVLWLGRLFRVSGYDPDAGGVLIAVMGCFCWGV